MRLQRVLFIDDRIDEFETVIKEFEDAGIQAISLTGEQQLREFLEKGDAFDAVILDWYFDSEESTLARLCLQRIKEARFVPVLVWTEEPEAFDNDLPQIDFFPRSCIERRGKSDVTKDHLVSYVSEWFTRSTVTTLSAQWRNSCARASEQVLYHLSHLEEKDITQALKVFLQAGGPVLDIDQSVEVLARLVQRGLMNDPELNKFLQELLTPGKESQQSPRKAKASAPSKVLSLHMYYQPNDEFVRTGDVVHLQIQDMEAIGVVITPACDLARPRTEYLRVLLTGEPTQTSGSQAADRCSLPFLPIGHNKYQDKELRFHEIICLKNLELAETTKVKDRTSVMLYSHHFHTFRDELVSINRIVRIDDPYRSDILQRFAAHSSRVGVPEF